VFNDGDSIRKQNLSPDCCLSVLGIDFYEVGAAHRRRIKEEAFSIYF
jgi:hypothetical protein